MSEPSAPRPRTPGAKRAGAGEYLFDLGSVNHILGGPDYSTANGACVEGDRMIVGLMRMPAGTGAEPHSHPNEQWIYVLQGTLRGSIGDGTWLNLSRVGSATPSPNANASPVPSEGRKLPALPIVARKPSGPHVQ